MGGKLGEPVGVPPPAGCRRSRCLALMILMWFAAPADHAAMGSSDGVVSFDLSSDSARNGLADPGMIGPSGAWDGEPADSAGLLPDEYAEGRQQVPPAPQLAPPSPVEDWILSDGGAADPGIVPFFRHRGRRLAAGAQPMGPVRRWIHGLFDGPPMLFGAGHAAAPPWLREQWRFRPFSIGWFMGGVSGSPLLDDWVNQESGYFAGYVLGWDFTRYWGCQMRLGFGWLTLADSQRAIDAQEARDASLGLPRDDPFLRRFDQRRDSDLVLWDVSLVYYPWGNTTWRPYLAAGLGAARIDFLDRLSVRRADTVFEMPLGVGMKYRLRDWLALRFDFTDNIVFGSSFDTVHDLSFTGGVEILFGGTRKAYWPWNPGRHYW